MNTGSFKKILDNTEVVDYFKDDKCSECGQCCSRFLALSNYEINTIKAYIKRKNIKQQTHAVNVLAQRALDMTCPFLDDDKPNHKCTIYEVRPLICRSFSCRRYLNHEIDPELYKVPRTKIDVTKTFFPSGIE